MERKISAEIKELQANYDFRATNGGDCILEIKIAKNQDYNNPQIILRRTENGEKKCNELMKGAITRAIDGQYDYIFVTELSAVTSNAKDISNAIVRVFDDVAVQQPAPYQLTAVPINLHRKEEPQFKGFGAFPSIEAYTNDRLERERINNELRTSRERLQQIEIESQNLRNLCTQQKRTIVQFRKEKEKEQIEREKKELVEALEKKLNVWNRVEDKIPLMFAAASAAVAKKNPELAEGLSGFAGMLMQDKTPQVQQEQAKKQLSPIKEDAINHYTVVIEKISDNEANEMLNLLIFICKDQNNLPMLLQIINNQTQPQTQTEEGE